MKNIKKVKLTTWFILFAAIFFILTAYTNSAIVLMGLGGFCFGAATSLMWYDIYIYSELEIIGDNLRILKKWIEESDDGKQCITEESPKKIKDAKKLILNQ